MPDELERRRAEVAASEDLQALLARLTARAAPLIEQMPIIPAVKALLSSDGGVCPEDGTTLAFDPWSPDRHRCPRCGKEWTGERHHRHWAKWQHLWLAERAAHLAALAALAGDAPAGVRASQILRFYGERYLDYPNRDNVLGPARLFFSTYLESVWVTNYIAAAQLLRSAGALDDATVELVSSVADEAANLIGEFDEGLSNRQTWHHAALLAIAVWFEDEDLARRALESETGLATHLTHGFGSDGMWYEGENYHLFALQGLITGIAWARAAGVDLMADPELASRFHAALRAPTVSALPDFSYPARKDSRFGISLAQPMYLESWETGLGLLGDTGEDLRELRDWLAALYARPAPPAATLESWLHEAGEPAPATRGREDLAWPSLISMLPSPGGSADEWHPASELLESQGLAVLRDGQRHVGLECGGVGGGHGHPDRLNLTVHANGIYWLPDLGTGSYVSPDLFWYRSTLAHNAPRLDGRSQPFEDAVCDAFDVAGDWSWVRGRFGELSRTVVAGPGYLLDLIELDAAEERVLELPWHFMGSAEADGPGTWAPATLSDAFAHDAMRLDRSEAVTVLRVRAGESQLSAFLAFDGELLRAAAPGAPGAAADVPFYLQRVTGRSAMLVAVLDTSGDGSAVSALRVTGHVIEVDTPAGTDSHAGSSDGWTIDRGGTRLRLGGRRVQPVRFQPLLTPRAEPPRGVASMALEAPALDGSLDGWDDAEPLLLDHDDQYRRSEEPYAGPEEFAATAWVNWDMDRLYVAVEVAKAEPWFRPPGSQPLRLDNEPDDIHSDGIQIYFRGSGATPVGLLIVSEPGGSIRSRSVAGTAPGTASGGWEPTDTGYRITVALASPDWSPAVGDILDFDLIVNEMHDGRERRAGQLVWSGGGGWVWLRGDRQDPARFGELDLR